MRVNSEVERNVTKISRGNF